MQALIRPTRAELTSLKYVNDCILPVDDDTLLVPLMVSVVAGVVVISIGVAKVATSVTGVPLLFCVCKYVL